jgi:hypothetical protein
MERSISDGDPGESVVGDKAESTINLDDSTAEPTTEGVHISLVVRSSNKKRKTTSWVWDHFTRIKDRPTCMECMSRRGQSPTSYSALTSNSVFNRHLNISHAITKDRGVAGDCHQKTLSSTGRLNRRDMLGDERCAEVLTVPVRWVADDKQSFSVAENSLSRNLFMLFFVITSFPVVGLSEERWWMSSRVR